MRRHVGLILALALTLLVAAPASADGTKLAHQRAVSAVPVRPTMPGNVAVVIDPSLPHLGAASSTTITLQSSAYDYPQVIYHELGHVYDWRSLTDADRQTFLNLIGRPTIKWYATYWEPSGAECFADALMQLWRLPRIDPRWRYVACDHGLLGSQLLAVGEWLVSEEQLG